MSKYICEILIISLIAVTAILCYIMYINTIKLTGHYLLIAVLGIAALIIPIILSISSEYNIGSKLDSGEIRKSIVISLTIIYIIFLVMSFDQTMEVRPPSGGKYLLNVSYDENMADAAHKNIVINISSTSEGVLQVIPVTATANVANGTVQITPHVSNKTGAGDGGPGAITLTSDNGTSLPTDAINSFTKNFLWVYALIISFYFGSRILEDRREKNNVDTYISKLVGEDGCPLDPLDIAKARFSLGDIGPREFMKLREGIEGNPTVTIKKAYFRKSQNKEQKDGLLTLCIWNGTEKNIKVRRATIFGKELEMVKECEIISKNCGTVNFKHGIEKKEQIGFVKIETMPTRKSITGGEYSNLILQDQIEEIKD